MTTNAAKYGEVDAMRDVDTALGQLDTDERVRVIDWVSSKYGINLPRSSNGGQKSPEPVGGGDERPKDIKSFLVNKDPQNFYERVACLVYYLDKFDDKPEVSTKDITKANSDARQSRLTNPAVFVKNATHSYGYLNSLGKRKFAVSARGEAVVEALPDRTKVEEAHKKFRFGRKTKKTKK